MSNTPAFALRLITCSTYPGLWSRVHTITGRVAFSPLEVFRAILSVLRDTLYRSLTTTIPPHQRNSFSTKTHNNWVWFRKIKYNCIANHFTICIFLKTSGWQLEALYKSGYWDVDAKMHQNALSIYITLLRWLSTSTNLSPIQRRWVFSCHSTSSFCLSFSPLIKESIHQLDRLAIR